MKLATIVAAGAVCLLVGCAPLLTGTTDPAKISAIMQSTNAAGCIYARASAAPWASITTIIVGTWGDPRPSLQECWKQLPPELP